MTSSLEMIWSAPPDAPTTHPCVDCGLLTGNFCDGSTSVGYDKCFATNRVPHDYTSEAGYDGFRTPLCTYCETCFEFCRFCRGVEGCTPPTRRNHWSGIPVARSRLFDAHQHRLSTLKYFESKRKTAKEPKACEDGQDKGGYALLQDHSSLETGDWLAGDM